MELIDDLMTWIAAETAKRDAVGSYAKGQRFMLSLLKAKLEKIRNEHKGLWHWECPTCHRQGFETTQPTFSRCLDCDSSAPRGCFPKGLTITQFTGGTPDAPKP